LIWFGNRGSDAEAVKSLPELSFVCSVICPFEGGDTEQFCLEDSTRLRVDLNRYDIDSDDCVELQLLKRKMSSVLENPSALVTYRPTEFLTSLIFPNQSTAEYYGIFHLEQSAFEHKPWLENQLKKAGIPIVPWRYYSDEEAQRAYNDLGDSPFILRINRGSGGAGLVLIRESRDIINYWPQHNDGFLAATPYLYPNISFCINACLFSDGTVSIFAPSAQLIGLSCCTNRSFGFCGNDFGLPKTIPNEILNELEEMVINVGGCLHKRGYLGAFGVDVILFEDRLLLSEVNPRFQASSPPSGNIAEQLDLADVYLEHLAAFMGLPPIKQPPLFKIVEMQPPISQIICYNRGRLPIKRADSEIVTPEGITLLELPSSNIAVEPEGELFKCIVNGAVSKNSFELDEKVDRMIEGFITRWIHGGAVRENRA
jgi:hypothetical protein